VLPLARAGEEVAEWGTWIAIAAVLTLVAGLLYAWPAPIVAALVAIAGLYGAQLAIDDAPLDVAAVFVGAGLLVTAELAYWSLEEREPVESDPGEAWRRFAFVCLLGLAALGAAALLVAVVDAVSARGLAIDLLGAVAAATVVVTLVLAARAKSS
jgi:hypothetical protein